MMARENLPWWIPIGLIAGIALGTNTIASVMSWVTIELMRGVSDFALAVRVFEKELLPYYRTSAYIVVTLVIANYLGPIAGYFRYGEPQPAPDRVRRRVVGTPLFVALAGFAPWALSVVFFPAATLIRYGRWSPDLSSQQVFSPLVSGFLAATTTYLLLDWMFRTSIIPRVFPQGRVYQMARPRTIGVQGRFFVFLFAVAFLPLFTVIGLIQAAAARLEAGFEPAQVMDVLTRAAGTAFILYVLLGTALTLLMGRTLTGPLSRVATALRRVQSGDLKVTVEVGSADEVGFLEDGINSTVSSLREKDHIMQAFGRVVEPAVRDHLISGNLRLGGELRRATVMFVDLKGFTALAERSTPDSVVATLNEFFTALTAWVRECGGFVDKFIGDAMLVVFGLFENGAKPLPDGGAGDGLRCALGVMDRLGPLNDARERTGEGRLEVSVGLHTGEVLAGTIGAQDRHEYTVVGDTVNVAARLQQLCKEQDRNFVVSQAAYEAAKQSGFDGELVMHDLVTLRGRAEPVRVFGPA